MNNLEDDKGYWYNYKTGKYELFGTPQTDEQAKLYLPQYPAAQKLYDVCRLHGLPILDSMEEVLKAVILKMENNT